MLLCGSNPHSLTHSEERTGDNWRDGIYLVTIPQFNRST